MIHCYVKQWLEIYVIGRTKKMYDGKNHSVRGILHEYCIIKIKIAKTLVGGKRKK
jgi:hypothetical protein